MASTTEVNISQSVNFFGSLMGTTGISDENNKICNKYINRLLISLEPFVKDYEDEAKETLEFRAAEKKRMEEEPELIVAPTGHDYNNLKIR
jgi:hypothetical protein